MATTDARSALTMAGMPEESGTLRAAKATPLRDSTVPGGVRSSTVGPDEDDTPPGDLGAPQETQQLVGLAAEHAAG